MLLRGGWQGGYNFSVMQVKDVGEFGVIGLLNEMIVEQRAQGCDGSPDSQLLVDTGDDAAAWKVGETTELLTTDTMVEGVHFTRKTTPWGDLGWKALAANISDIAAMGGLPKYALVTLGLPPETEVEDIRDLYRGMLDIANAYGVSLVGGDTVRSDAFFITIGLTGVHPGQPMVRSAAQVGDEIAVTGPVGSSGGGLKLMLECPQAAGEAADYLRERHRRPEPAVAQGRILADNGVYAAMDVSDGLGDDLSKLCCASRVAARIYSDQVPVHPFLSEVFPEDSAGLALDGGEDYVLLFTAAPGLMRSVLPLLPDGAAVIGETVAGEPGRVMVVDSSGVERAVARGGWDHFGG